MNPINSTFNREKRIKQLRIAIFVVSFVLVIAIGAAVKQAMRANTNGKNQIQEPVAMQVSTMTIGAHNVREHLSTAGVVTAETKIDVAALAPGTVRDLFVDVGDIVFGGELLASLHEGSIITNFETSRTNYQNLEQSLATTRALTDESVNLAGISVQQAEESVLSAKIALTTVQSNYETTLPEHVQQTKKAIQDAIIAYHTNLQSVQDTLDDINFIIRAQGTRQRENISSTLSIGDPASLDQARDNWKIADAAYDVQILQTVSEKNVKQSLNKLITLLDQTLTAANDSVAVLQYTTANFLFSEAELEQERSSIVALKTNIANNKAAVTNSRDALSSLETTQQKEKTALLNATRAAENQLALARIAYDTATVQRASAERNRDQQLLGAQTTLDSARGQRNLAGQSVADLSVRAPIRGNITGRYVEIGTKVSAGQKIVEISQTDLVTIEVGLSQSDANRVRVGDVVTTEGKFAGVINRIDPVADPFSRKVNVEILFDNSQKDLIPETFVNVEIPLTNPELASSDTETILVPIKAVTITNSERYVFVVNGNHAKKIIVETGNPVSDHIEILSGLALGTELIVEGNKRLEDGDEISVQE